MNKMLRNIIIMVVVIAVAVGAIILMPLLTKEEAPEPTATPEKLVYSNYKIDDVKEVTVQNETETFTLHKVDDKWSIKGKDDIALDQNKAAGIVQSAAYVTAGQKVAEDMVNAADFGLDKPQATISATFSDGVEHVYYVGDKTPDGSNYYMTMKGNDEIFTVWMNYGLNGLKTVNELRQLTQLSIAMEDITQVDVTNREGSYSIKEVGEDERISIFAWEVVAPYQRPVETEAFQTFLTEVTSVKVSGVVEGEVTDLAKYGMDKPWGKVTLTTRDGKIETLNLGNDVDESNVSVMFEGEDTVYKMAKSALSFMETTPWELSDKMLSLIAVANVDQVLIKLPNGEATLDIDHVTRLDDDGKEKKDGNGKPIQDHVYSLDGVKLSDEDITDGDKEYKSPQEQAVWYYQVLIGLRIHSVLDDPDFVGEKVAASIKYAIKNRDGEHNVVFYEYNADFYAVKINDEDNYYLVSTRDLEEAEAKLALLREGKLERGY